MCLFQLKVQHSIAVKFCFSSAHPVWHMFQHTFVPRHPCSSSKRGGDICDDDAGDMEKNCSYPRRLSSNPCVHIGSMNSRGGVTLFLEKHLYCWRLSLNSKKTISPICHHEICNGCLKEGWRGGRLWGTGCVGLAESNCYHHPPPCHCDYPHFHYRHCHRLSHLHHCPRWCWVCGGGESSCNNHHPQHLRRCHPHQRPINACHYYHLCRNFFPSHYLSPGVPGKY